jgi:oxygen-independent coproporphyrinogen-3 oxidase
VTSLDAILARTRYEAYVYAYPHKTAYRALDPAVPLAPLWAGEDRRALFLYVHVPFCEMRCGFCNLFTRPVPDDATIDAYVDALARQARVVRRALDDGGRFAFARVAIGGGTPTYLAPAQLARVLDVVRMMGAGPELPMSVETSPATATPDRLAQLVAAGADRISIGVQSFVDDEVRAVNRPQRADDVHRALRAIRDSGARALNIDLMYGLPGQTEATWRASLAAALEYRPEELYLYPLYVRPLTTLGRRGAEAEDDARVRLYELGRALLVDAGYQQISMRMFRRHDAATPYGPVYCCQADGMIGLGCGARSYTRALHYSSEWAVGARGVRDIIDRWIARDDDAFAVADYGFPLGDHEQRRRWLILSLLSDDGLDLAAYRTRFGDDARAHFPELGELPERGFAEQRGDTFALTRDGLARADALGAWLFSADVRARMSSYELR